MHWAKKCTKSWVAPELLFQTVCWGKTPSGQAFYFYFMAQGPHCEIARYLFGDRTDEILARWRSGEGTAWYLADHIGTIRDLVDAAGDPNLYPYKVRPALFQIRSPKLRGRSCDVESPSTGESSFGERSGSVRKSVRDIRCGTASRARSIFAFDGQTRGAPTAATGRRFLGRCAYNSEIAASSAGTESPNACRARSRASSTLSIETAAAPPSAAASVSPRWSRQTE